MIQSVRIMTKYELLSYLVNHQRIIVYYEGVEKQFIEYYNEEQCKSYFFIENIETKIIKHKFDNRKYDFSYDINKNEWSENIDYFLNKYQFMKRK